MFAIVQMQYHPMAEVPISVVAVIGGYTTREMAWRNLPIGESVITPQGPISIGGPIYIGGCWFDVLEMDHAVEDIDEDVDNTLSRIVNTSIMGTKEKGDMRTCSICGLKGMGFRCSRHDCGMVEHNNG